MSCPWLSHYLTLVRNKGQCKRPRGCYYNRLQGYCPDRCTLGLCTDYDGIMWNGELFVALESQSVYHNADGTYRLIQPYASERKALRTLSWRLLPGEDAFKDTFELLQFIARKSGCNLYTRHGAVMYADWQNRHSKLEIGKWYRCFNYMFEERSDAPNYPTSRRI